MVDFPASRVPGVFDAYPFVLAVGALFSLLWLGFAHSEQADEGSARIDAGMVALLAGLLGARAGYVATHWSYFGARPADALFFWQGGLSWATGALGAVIGMAVYTGLRRQSFWSTADLIAIPAAMIAVAAWVGCLIDRCAYGQRASSGLFTPPAPDMLGNVAPRWPTQALGGLFSLLIIAVLYWVSTLDLRPGMLAAVSLFLIALIALALSFLRGDPVPVLAGMRMDGLGSAAIASLALAALILQVRK